MRERPILFSGPMVRGILDGRKTQTRRVVKPQAPAEAVDTGVISSGSNSNGLWCWLDCKQLEWASPVGDEFRCPYGVPGDLLWVRERSWIYGQWHREGETATGRPRWRFKAIGRQAIFENPGHEQIAYLGGGAGWSYRNSIHMPRWASRITLAITDVRVERLTSCSEADALAEGIIEYEADEEEDGDPAEYAWDEERGRGEIFPSAASAYADLWEHINGPNSWAADPWVWAVTFERVPT